MSRDDMKLLSNNLLLACQLCLGLWQFSKLTPVGALIQGAVAWLLRPLRLSPTYSDLQRCEGLVFKRANCFALQADIPSDRRGIVSPEVNTMNLHYLGSDFVLERKGEDGNMLFVDQKMCYYITDRSWKELQNLEQALLYGLEGPPLARAAVTRAHAERAEADAGRCEADLERAKSVAEHAEAEALSAHADAKRAESMASRPYAKAQSAEAERAEAEAELAEAEAELAEAKAKRAESGDKNSKARAKRAKAGAKRAEAGAKRAEADAERAEADAERAETVANYVEAARAAEKAAQASATDLTAKASAARANASAARSAAETRLAETADTTLFVKGKREFWKEVITGGVMPFKEVLDAIILYNQHVSVRLSNDWLLPVNLSVSEEKLLKVFNLVALFLQTKKNVHWLIPISLSFISALLEFKISLRVWIYTKINKLFCNIMHLICDRLPRSWRREVYSLGKWVENLAPSNDILVKVVRDKMCAIISEGAEVNKEGATWVRWLESDFTPDYGVIERQFRCHPIDIMFRCSYVVEHELCEISAPTICVFYVKCKSIDNFRNIVTLVSCVADKCCGSLISYGLNNKVCLRGFEESVISYVNNGLPPIYELELGNVVVAGKDVSH